MERKKKKIKIVGIQKMGVIVSACWFGMLMLKIPGKNLFKFQLHGEKISLTKDQGHVSWFSVGSHAAGHLI